MRAATRRTAGWLAAHPFVACVLWALWLSALYGVFGSHSYVRVFDNADGVLPAKASLSLWVSGAKALGSWAFPWATGVDRGAIELDTMPFLVLPGWLAYWLVMFGQRLVAAYFGYRLARDRWSLNRAGAWFLALWYSAFIQPHINASLAGWTLYDSLTMAAVPAIAWLLLSRDLPRRRLLLLAAGAGILYAWTSSYPFAAFIMILLAVVLAASDSRGRDTWLAFGVFAAVWALAELPELLPGLWNAATSHRADRQAYTPLTLPFSEQVLLAVNIVRDNLVGVVLGVWAAVRFRIRSALILLIAFACAALAVALAEQGDAALDAYGGPLSAFLFERFYFLLPFLAASAGAVGVDSLRMSGARTVRLVAFASIALVVVLSAGVNVTMAAEMVFGSNYAAVLEDPALVALSDETAREGPFRVATVVAPTSDTYKPQPSFAWAQGLDTADGYLSLYPQRYQDFWERVIGPLIAKDRGRFNYYHYWGNRIYLFEQTGGFPPGPVQVARYYDLDLLALANVRYLVSGRELADPRLREISHPGQLPGSPQRVYLAWKYVPFWLGQLTGDRPVSSVYVYELQDTLPRAFVAGSVRTFPTRAALLDALAVASVDELRTRAFVEQTDGHVAEPAGGTGEALSIERSSDRLQISVESTTAALLIVTVQYSRFWSAAVDDAIVPVVAADGPFMAVPIPAGRHTVVMRYEPPYEMPLVE